MCGISGYLNVARNEPTERMEATVGRMADVLRHRGPDGRGTWCDADAGIALGHRRLAIIDVSPEGHQPMVSASGRYVVVYNGEIYNFPALRRELEPRGHRFRGHSDTEVLLAAVEEWGIEATLPRLNGMYAFALWDRRRRNLHLVRDRLGEKPLYYGWCGSAFAFGSELKALRAHPDFGAPVDRSSLALFLRFNYVPAPYSIYAGIAKLPPATMLTLDAEASPPALPAPRAYWDLRAIAQAAAPQRRGGGVTAQEWSAQLDGLLREAVSMRMVADVPLGAFLSGGVDSSTIVALMQAQSERPVRTFSIGFHESAFNEAQHARAVAAHLGTDHTELYVTPQEAREVIPRLPQIYDEPFSDSSQIPTFLVSALARTHVTVSLSGDGGDELFGGYNRYFWGQRLWRHLRVLPPPLRAALNGAARAIPRGAYDALGLVAGRLLRRELPPNLGDKVHKAAAVLGAATMDALYGELISHWRDPAQIVQSATEPWTQHRSDLSQEFPEFRERMMYLDTVTYLPDDILVKVDRAAMSVSLESRIPLLDHRVVEFAWRLPPELKFRNGQGKWLLRQVLHSYVPRGLIERPKMGFGVPIGAWLRGPLREWAEALLDASRLRREGYFHTLAIRKKWEEHQCGSRNWQYLLWDVLMFQAWQEQEHQPTPALPRIPIHEDHSASRSAVGCG